MTTPTYNRSDLSPQALKAWQQAHPELDPDRGKAQTTITKVEYPEKVSAQELRAALQGLTERLDLIEADLSALRDGLAQAASQPAATAPTAGTGQTVQFDCSLIVVGVDDNGQATYKAKGGQYQKFGVRIWPEALGALGIDPASLHPGPNPVNLHLVALMGDKGPRKVIGLA